ncbi:MAG: 2-amino-4-hydroxy-6-hydroxymethyldihydropteridine diphosphokinase [Planctomycetota bacterium]
MTTHGGIFIALGSNLGDRAGHIYAALRELAEPGDVRVVACSSLHETEPIGGPPGQPPYLNAVAELATHLEPRALLLRMQAIEGRHGRERTVPNGPRTLDLDLLLHGDRVLAEPDLTVPHPRMWQRAFVMEPLAEVCGPDRLVPVLGRMAQSRAAFPPWAGPAGRTTATSPNPMK